MAAAVGAPMILNEKNIDRPPLLTEGDFDDDHEDEKIAPVPKRPLVMVRYSLNIQTLGTLSTYLLGKAFETKLTSVKWEKYWSDNTLPREHQTAPHPPSTSKRSWIFMTEIYQLLPKSELQNLSTCQMN